MVFWQETPYQNDRILVHTTAVRSLALLYNMTAAQPQAKYQNWIEAASVVQAILFQPMAEVQQAMTSLHNKKEVADRPLPPAFPRQEVDSLAVLNAYAHCSFVHV